MTYTSPTGPIIRRAFGKFQGLAYVALTAGQLVGRNSTNGWIVADSETGPVIAEAVVLENIAAGIVGWFALAVEIQVASSIGGRGVPTAGALAEAGDICKPLYLGAAGVASESVGTVTQRVGWVESTEKAVLMPGQTLTGSTLTVTTLTLSGNATIGGTLTQTGVATFTAKDVHSAGITIASAKGVEGAGTGANGFVILNPKNAATKTLSGTALDVEISIGGTPYYFHVYPTAS